MTCLFLALRERHIHSMARAKRRGQEAGGFLVVSELPMLPGQHDQYSGVVANHWGALHALLSSQQIAVISAGWDMCVGFMWDYAVISGCNHFSDKLRVPITVIRPRE